MNITPIQVLDEGVLIPTKYLDDAVDFEFEMRNGAVLVRPKVNGSNGHAKIYPDAEPELRSEDEIDPEEYAALKRRYPWIGAAKGLDPDLSVRAEEILAAEIDPRSG